MPINYLFVTSQGINHTAFVKVMHSLIENKRWFYFANLRILFMHVKVYVATFLRLCKEQYFPQTI